MQHFRILRLLFYMMGRDNEWYLPFLVPSVWKTHQHQHTNNTIYSALIFMMFHLVKNPCLLRGLLIQNPICITPTLVQSCTKLATLIMDRREYLFSRFCLLMEMWNNSIQSPAVQYRSLFSHKLAQTFHSIWNRGYYFPLLRYTPSS